MFFVVKNLCYKVGNNEILIKAINSAKKLISLNLFGN